MRRLNTRAVVPPAVHERPTVTVSVNNGAMTATLSGTEDWHFALSVLAQIGTYEPSQKTWRLPIDGWRSHLSRLAAVAHLSYQD